MREILFRGIPKEKSDGYTFSKIWSDNCDGSFVYGSLLISKGKYYICASSIFKINCCINNAMMSVIEVIPESVGQYTGLTDKNGKKVFEGDVVVIDHTINTRYWETIPETHKPRRSHSLAYDEEKDLLTYKRNYAVEWKEKDARWILRNGSDQHNLNKIYFRCHNGIVIGNIHDNPELLKGGGNDA